MKETNLSYKKASLTDIEYLLWLRKETMTEHLINSGIAINDEEHLIRIMYQFDDAKIIFLNENPIGLLKVKETEDHIEIIQIQIDPKLQGKGIGKLVLTSIINKAAAQNLPLQLSVLKKNKAKNLYYLLGFEIIEENEDSFIMQKK